MLEVMKKWCETQNMKYTIVKDDEYIEIYLGSYEVVANDFGGHETTYGVAYMRYLKSNNELKMLHVQDKWRNKGIASLLVNSAIELGADCVSAEPLPTEKEQDLDKLIQFYYKFGFKVSAKADHSAWMLID